MLGLLLETTRPKVFALFFQPVTSSAGPTHNASMSACRGPAQARMCSGGDPTPKKDWQPAGLEINKKQLHAQSRLTDFFRHRSSLQLELWGRQIIERCCCRCRCCCTWGCSCWGWTTFLDGSPRACVSSKKYFSLFGHFWIPMCGLDTNVWFAFHFEIIVQKWGVTTHKTI